MDAAPLPTAPAVISRRRWLQFSLRSMLALTFACGGGLGVWNVYIEPYRRQRRLAAEVAELGGMVSAATNDAWWTKFIGGEFFSNVTEIGFFQNPRDDAWLARLSHVPHLRGLYLQDTLVSDDALAEVARLTELRTLSLPGSGVTDAGIDHLLGVKSLEVLDLSATNVTDVGIGRLVANQLLAHLMMNDTDLTEASLKHFQKLPKLSSLELSGTHIIPSALREALPHLDAWERTTLLAHGPFKKEFTDARLIDIMDWFRQCMIDMKLDKSSGQELGIDLETRITIALSDTSMGSALSKAFAPLGLKCVPCYGIVLITARDDPGFYPVHLTLRRGERLSRKFSQGLYSRAYVRFSDMPLTNVIGFFEEDRGIEIRLDDSVPATVGDSLVTCTFENTATANALELILRDLDLYGEIENNAIHVRSGPITE